MRRLRYLDLALLAPLFGICFLLWLALYSATQFTTDGEATKQLLYAFLGGSVMIGLAAVDYHRLMKLGAPIYLFTMATLIGVVVAGQEVNGARRWLDFGPLGRFQPAEIAKLAIVIVLARVLSQRLRPGNLLVAVSLVCPIFLLILIQPDLGTALVVVVTAMVMAYLAGVNGTLLFSICGLGVLGLSAGLKEYQRDRLMVFVNPDIDPSGMGYSLVQSRTAIGSGGLMGEGLLQGHMTQHGFVPENWTDFIFTVVGEEFGFLGGCGLLMMFSLLIVMILVAGYRAVDRTGALLCGGVAVLLLLQVVINIGMTVGLAPVVGLPLPFGSYGGSALLTNLAAIGLVLSVRVESRLPEEPLSDSVDCGKKLDI